MSIADDLKDRIRERAEDIVDRASDDLQEEIEREAPVSSLSSGGGLQLRGPGQRLRDSVVTNPFSAGDTYGVRAKVESDYASYVEEGTDPHTIEPHDPKGVLAFYWPRFNKMIFVKHVQHPGTEANPFFSRALSRWSQILEQARGSV